jgi:NOL1/NOP2/fmu family ribosome biogenesis protein
MTGPSGTAGAAGDEPTNDGSRFDRLPPTDADRRVRGRPTRAVVVDWWRDRYGIDAFDDHTLWEKGAGKVWAYAGEAPDPVRVETLGLPVLRARQRFWKPTTDAVQRFGRSATRNVIRLDEPAARAFLAGEDRPVEWDGDPGYLIASHRCAGRDEPIGVGLWTDGELRSTVPKGRRREL